MYPASATYVNAPFFYVYNLFMGAFLQTNQSKWIFYVIHAYSLYINIMRLRCSYAEYGLISQFIRKTALFKQKKLAH